MEVLTQAMLSGKNMFLSREKKLPTLFEVRCRQFGPLLKNNTIHIINEKILVVELCLDQLIKGLYLAFSRFKHFLGKCAFSLLSLPLHLDTRSSPGWPRTPSPPLSWVTGMITTLGTVCS